MAGVELFKGSDTDMLDEQLKQLISSDPELNQSKSLFQNQDMVKIIETYVEEDLPEDIKQNKILMKFFGFVYGRSVKLSFLDKDDVQDMEYYFEDCRLSFMMHYPVYEYKTEDLGIIEQFRLVFRAACQRAVGSQTHKFNERIILGGSINQVIRSNSENISAGGSGGGIFSKLKSIF